MSRNIFKTIRESKSAKFFAAFIAINIITQIGFPTISFALTSGPGQEEFASFEPASTSDMVSLYTGDFNYNIPLLTIPGPNGGYPINMAYHSGVGMDEEASWVGLGWCLNVGAINRQTRGLPDDYNPKGSNVGYNVVHTMYVKPNVTASYAIPTSNFYNKFGFESTTPKYPTNVEIYYNNYKGIGYRVTPFYGLVHWDIGGLAHLGLGISYDSQTGLGIEPDLSISGQLAGARRSLDFYGNINTRTGLQDFGFSTSATVSGSKGIIGGGDNNQEAKDVAGSYGGFTAQLPRVSFMVGQVPAEINIPMRNETYALDLKIGSGNNYFSPLGVPPGDPLTSNLFDYFEADGFTQIGVNVNISKVLDGGIVNDNGYGYLYTSAAGPTGTSVTDFHRDDIPYSDNVPNLPPSSFTYDIFSQTGQGTGSQFRPYSSYNGVITDAVRHDKSNSYNLNMDIGSNVNEFNLRLGLDYTHGVGYTGPWQITQGYFDDISPGLNGLNYQTPNVTTYQDYQPDAEDAYFQVYGEKSSFMLGDDYLANWKYDDAVRVDIGEYNNPLDWFNWHFTTTDNLDENGTQVAPIYNLKYKHNYQYQRRQVRGTNIEWLTNTDANNFGYSKHVVYGIPGNGQANKDFHLPDAPEGISEISCVQDDGMRYVYGLPTYNVYQMDATFSVWGTKTDPSGTPVGGGPGISTTGDPTKAVVPSTNNNIDTKQITTFDNTNSSQEYLSQTELKQPYANSWLLTSVLSDDYIDKTGNGPSLDDYGYWVKFDYKQTTNPASGSPDYSGYYHWRIPYEYSNYIKGCENDPDDDKGTLSYGAKELYYIDSIETKTHIAVFYTSPRNDGAGVGTKSSGGIVTGGAATGSTDQMYKLDSIKLFARASFKSANPLPIKTVHFEYDYTLCQGVPNNIHPGATTVKDGNQIVPLGSGKLTLKSVYFTYQYSKRGQLSPYQFSYSSVPVHSNCPGVPIPGYLPNTNPSYADTYIDRWGTFKDNSIYPAPTYPSSGTYPYQDFPYTDQYQCKTTLDSWASAWQLSSISLPTGGTINITYEMKDYAYVENQPAQDMFDIVGFNQAPVGGEDNRLGGSPAESTEGNDEGAVYFKLKQTDPISQFNLANAVAASDGGHQYIYQNCLNNGGLQSVYFKVFEELIPNESIGNDYVSGYANIDYGRSMGVIQLSTDNTYYGYVHLKTVPISKQNWSGTYINPITLASIEHIRADRPELIYEPNGATYTTNGWGQIASFVVSLYQFIPDIIASVSGFNHYALSNQWGTNAYLNGKSVIRLCDNTGKKFGGGARVQKLTLSDNWVNDGSDNYKYGQVYTYTTDGTANGPSSGVAYEPETGDDENALHTPVPYILSVPLGSNTHLFVENPVLKDYYPGPSVGYSMVTVTSIGRQNAISENPSNNLTHSAAPVTKYEFYTAKDFPIIQKQTDLTDDPAIIRPFAIPGLYQSFFKRKARSQGYSVIINDMAGKMKRLSVYTQPTTNNPSGTRISEQDYTYQTTQPYSPDIQNELSSQVQVLTSLGNYQTAKMGESSEVYIDMNENEYHSNTFGLDGQFDVSYDILGLFYLMIFPYISQTGANMRTVVTNKVIYRTGILQSVTTTTDQSKITQTNLAYDPETGEPLLTSVTNEFDDNVYNASIPAYWEYGNMDGEYLNQGFMLGDPSGSQIVGYFGATGSLNIVPSLLPSNNGTYGQYYANVENYFTAGDELYLTGSVSTSNTCNNASTDRDNIVTVVGVSPGNNQITCIDQCGNYPTGSITSLKVIKSGYRNLQSMKAGTIVAKTLTGTFPANPSTPAPPASIFTLSNIIDAKIVTYNDQWKIQCCNPYGVIDQGGNSTDAAVIIGNINCNCTDLNQPINPYLAGILGIWRPNQSYAYVVDNRTQAGNIRTDGIYPGALGNFNFHNPSNSSPNWVAANTITNYSPYGFELENKNAINVYSAAMYGYSNSLVTAVGSNAEYHEIGFDGFEDYPSTCDDQHFRFPTAYPTYITNTQAHTGHYSLHLNSGQTITQYYLVGDNTDACEQTQSFSSYPATGGPLPSDDGGNVPVAPTSNPFGGEVHNGTTATVFGSSDYYTMSSCDCLGQFYPTTNKAYELGAWVKQIPQTGQIIYNGNSAVNNQQVPNSLTTYGSPEIVLTFYAGTTVIGTSNSYASGNIIEGWQRIDATFTPPIGTTKVGITLINNTVPGPTQSDDYFDDIRVHPFNGNLNTYVYDNKLLKVMAELDPNNYATIYNYDDEGHLTKVKKETINGIETIKEGRINNVEASAPNIFTGPPTQ